LNDDEITSELVRRIQLGMADFAIDFIKDTNPTIEELHDLLIKVMEQIGILWEQEKLSLTQIYVAGMIMGKVIENFFPVTFGTESSEKPRIVLGCITEDFHSLGKELVKRFLTPFFRIRDLGINVSPEDFVQAAKEDSAEIIAVSALMMNAARNIEKLRGLIEDEDWENKPLLIVGGAPFNIDGTLWQRLGADYVIKSAIEAPSLILGILKERGLA
jgi:5-methyltetrahydrofolate--homocysteine methyltransferase